MQPVPAWSRISYNDLIELRHDDAYKAFFGSAKLVNKLVLQWNKRQQELLRQGLEKKYIEALATDKRKNTDLEWLKTQGGPFTRPEEVDTFLLSPPFDKSISEAEKQNKFKSGYTKKSDMLATPLFHFPKQVIYSSLKQSRRCCPLASWQQIWRFIFQRYPPTLQLIYQILSKLYK